MIEFELKEEDIKLFHLLKSTGLCPSGGAAKFVVSQSLVKVDGQIETRKACKIHKGQKVEFEGQIIMIK
jgi:ribosome-associated protein